MSPKHLAVVFGLSVVGLFSLMASAAYVRKPSEARIVIKAALFPAGTFDGGCLDKACTGLSVTEKDGKVTVSIPFSSIQVGTGAVFGGRTAHMHSVFGKNNRVTLMVPKSELKLPEDGKELSGTAKGMLSIRDGKAVPKRFSYKLKRSGNAYFVTEGSFDVNVQDDFGIDPKQKLSKFGVHLKPQVLVREVRFTVQGS